MTGGHMTFIEEYLGWEIYLDMPAKMYYAIDPSSGSRYGPSRSRAELKLYIKRVRNSYT
jgi:hypothetical protein